jgi:Plavaka transposase
MVVEHTSMLFIFSGLPFINVKLYLQKAVEENTPGATIIPIIISSDKTQITLFRNKMAYPVYLTIGNLPKSIRRKPSQQGQILLAYLPCTRLMHITNKAARRRTQANLFHAAMGYILEPLKGAGIQGIEIASGDGVICRGHPILAAYVGDYPEQCLVTGAFTGDCPGCDCPRNELENYPPEYPPRDLDAVLDALEQLGTPEYTRLCREVNIKPIQHPFWEDLPYVNIFRSITPDILHQLHQGVVKHLISWLKDTCGASTIDE